MQARSNFPSQTHPKSKAALFSQVRRWSWVESYNTFTSWRKSEGCLTSTGNIHRKTQVDNALLWHFVYFNVCVRVSQLEILCNIVADQRKFYARFIISREQFKSLATANKITLNRPVLCATKTWTWSKSNRQEKNNVEISLKPAEWITSEHSPFLVTPWGKFQDFNIHVMSVPVSNRSF